MSISTFRKLLTDTKKLSPVLELFFGGYGEPLYHPEILDFILRATRIGAITGLITNGTLLNPDMSRALISAGLDRLWISVDSAHLESYQDEGEKSYQQHIINNLGFLQEIRKRSAHPAKNPGLPELGLSFVLTKNNLPDLKDWIQLGKNLGIQSIFITNLEVYSEEMAGQSLIQKRSIPQRAARNQGRFNLPDLANQITNNVDGLNIYGSLTNPPTKCPFAEKGELVVRWDGEISPCLPLLYDHTSILDSWKRQVKSFSLGNISSRSLGEIWFDREYTDLRTKLLGEDFSPCFSCRDCWLSEDNLLDCMGFEHPTCGGCLWAHGLVACP